MSTTARNVNEIQPVIDALNGVGDYDLRERKLWIFKIGSSLEFGFGVTYPESNSWINREIRKMKDKWGDAGTVITPFRDRRCWDWELGTPFAYGKRGEYAHYAFDSSYPLPWFANPHLPTVTFSGGGSPTRAASAEAVVGANGTITSINILDGGAGYSSAPTVTISSINASVFATITATATATISGGSVNSITVTDGKTDYLYGGLLMQGSPAYWVGTPKTNNYISDGFQYSRGANTPYPTNALMIATATDGKIYVYKSLSPGGTTVNSSPGPSYPPGFLQTVVDGTVTFQNVGPVDKWMPLPRCRYVDYIYGKGTGGKVNLYFEGTGNGGTTILDTTLAANNFNNKKTIDTGVLSEKVLRVSPTTLGHLFEGVMCRTGIDGGIIDVDCSRTGATIQSLVTGVNTTELQNAFVGAGVIDDHSDMVLVIFNRDANDYNTGVTASALAANKNKIISWFKAVYSNVHFMQAELYPLNFGSPPGGDVSLNDQQHQFFVGASDAMNNTCVLDFSNVFGGISSSAAIATGDLIDDGIHATNQGASKMSNDFESTLGIELTSGPLVELSDTTIQAIADKISAGTDDSELRDLHDYFFLGKDTDSSSGDTIETHYKRNGDTSRFKIEKNRSTETVTPLAD